MSLQRCFSDKQIRKTPLPEGCLARHCATSREALDVAKTSAGKSVAHGDAVNPLEMNLLLPPTVSAASSSQPDPHSLHPFFLTPYSCARLPQTRFNTFLVLAAKRRKYLNPRLMSAGWSPAKKTDLRLPDGGTGQTHKSSA